MTWSHTPEFLWGSLFLGGTLFLSLLIWAIHRYGKNRHGAVFLGGTGIFQAAVPALQFCAWYYCAYFALPFALHFIHPAFQEPFARSRVAFWHIGLVIGGFWFLYRLVRVGEAQWIQHKAKALLKLGSLEGYVLAMLPTALPTFTHIGALWVVLSLLPLPHSFLAPLHLLIAIAFILGIGSISHKAIVRGEETLLAGLRRKDLDTYAARGVQTRVQILRKFAVVFNGLIVFASILLLFPIVGQYGKSILASAGVLSVVLGFAAQRSLGTVFAGLQIALTQPIRLDDWVVVEGESGSVEEITLTYVVVRLWDLRRLVLPINYFIEHPFQDWTRTSSSLITTVKIRVDFSAPVEELRKQVAAWLAETPLWDKATYALQVTDSDATSMELRIIASATTNGNAFDLQCLIREKILTYIFQHAPASLAVSRQTTRAEPASS